MAEGVVSIEDTIAVLQSEEMIRSMLSLLFTERELEQLRSRWEVAQLLAGGATHRDIAASVPVAIGTVTRISPRSREYATLIKEVAAKAGKRRAVR